VRLLNTSAPGRNLLASPVIVPETTALAVIQTPLITPDGHTVIASITRDAPHGYYRGTIVARIAWISAVTGHQVAVYRTIRIPYRNNRQKYLAEASCQVLSVDTESGDTLAACKHLGKLAGGGFTPLRDSGALSPGPSSGVMSRYQRPAHRMIRRLPGSARPGPPSGKVGRSCRCRKPGLSTAFVCQSTW
jgi:hypothetical protein